MRIVLDTNVFVSGIFFSGPPSKILMAWKKQTFQLVLSHAIFNEYKRVGDELHLKYPLVDIAPIIEFVAIHGKFIDTKSVEISICRDHDDDKFIECAVAGKCNVIVSGDADLLDIKEYQGIMIVKPRDFVEKYMKR